MDPRNTTLRLPMGQCRAPDGQSSGVEIYLEIQSGNTVEMQPSLGKKRGCSCVPRDIFMGCVLSEELGLQRG